MSNIKYKYEEIVEDIKNLIKLKKYKDGDLLPSENLLCGKYAASRITVRNAISILLSQGYIYSVQGKGNYIKSADHNLFHLKYNIKSIFKNGYDEAKLTSSMLVKPDVYMVYNLRVSPEDRVVALKWLIYKDGRIIGYDEKYISYFVGVNIDESNLKYTDFHDLMKNKMSSYQMGQDIRLKGTNADESLAKVMCVKEGSILFLIESKIYDFDGEPLGWGRLYVDPSEIKITGNTKL